MTIKSVDMQVLVQKIGDVARVQQTQQQDHQARQQGFINEIQSQTQRNSKTVNETLRNEQKIVHEKQEKDGQKKENKSQRRTEAVATKESDTDRPADANLEPGRGENLDIFV